MAQKPLNTSRAVTQPVDIYDHDTLNLSITFDTLATPSAPIDLTDYRFDFYLKDSQNADRMTYTIAAGVLDSGLLQKTIPSGGSVPNVLVMQDMWEDIRSRVAPGTAYRLIQVATTPEDFEYAQVIYTINVGKY